MALCAASILAALGCPLVTGEVYTDTELGKFHLPMRDFWARCLDAGLKFIWQPHQLTGFYLHGEGQAGLFPPAKYLPYRVGWQARVDGRPCRLLRAYGDFMGCVIEPGQHMVRFSCEPASLRDGSRLSYVGLALIAGWSLFSWRTRTIGAANVRTVA